MVKWNKKKALNMGQWQEESIRLICNLINQPIANWKSNSIKGKILRSSLPHDTCLNEFVCDIT